MSTARSRRASLPPAGALGAAAAIAGASALWAGFQWQQLFVARSGGSAICGPGSGDCTALWDSGFASSVQTLSGLPIAGWGIVWSIAALVFPVWLLARWGRPKALVAAWSAACLVAAAGVVGVVVLALASLAAGQLCSTCAVTYLLVLGYAGVCAAQVSRFRPRQLARAGGIALGVGAIALALALPVGLGTPQAKLNPLHGLTARPEGGTDAALAELIGTLSAQDREMMLQALKLYRTAPPVPRRAPRMLIGPGAAKLRVTEFTDIRCGHCADLHETIEDLRELAPPGSVAFEPRQFPLDSACNATLDFPPQDPVRCEAARVLICLEGHPRYFEYAGSLFREQRTLNSERLYALARPLKASDELRACAASLATRALLRNDISWAEEHDIRGTPLVLINGRKAVAYPPFLYAMILAEGNPRHPGFDALR